MLLRFILNLVLWPCDICELCVVPLELPLNRSLLPRMLLPAEKKDCTRACLPFAFAIFAPKVWRRTSALLLILASRIVCSPCLRVSRTTPREDEEYAPRLIPREPNIASCCASVVASSRCLSASSCNPADFASRASSLYCAASASALAFA